MPTFGRSILEHWLLDPEYTYLNHGTVGAAPRRVLARQQALREEQERCRTVRTRLNVIKPPYRVCIAPRSESRRLSR